MAGLTKYFSGILVTIFLVVEQVLKLHEGSAATGQWAGKGPLVCTLVTFMVDLVRGLGELLPTGATLTVDVF